MCVCFSGHEDAQLSSSDLSNTRPCVWAAGSGQDDSWALTWCEFLLFLMRPASELPFSLSPTTSPAFHSAPPDPAAPSSMFKSSLSTLSVDLISFLCQTRVTVFPPLSQPLWPVCYTAVLLARPGFLPTNQRVEGQARSPRRCWWRGGGNVQVSH